MSRQPYIRALSLLVFALALSQVVTAVQAQSSLGIGTNDAITPSTGLFAGLTQWINVHQQQFYRALTGALKEMRDDGGKIRLLVGLSFAYGVFHAAGPGHGKAVISSYMLANEVALRRGIMLAFVSAFLQGVTALVMMGLVFLVLRRTAISMTDATWFLEIASYALITAFGAWLLWKKAAPKLRGMFGGNPALSLSSAQTHIHTAGCTHPSHKTEARGFVCEDCGHSHMADPALISGDRFDWRTAWTAVAAVGLRPCTGAIIVLSFSFLNELWLGGILSVAAMSLGTAITVSLLAVLAVTAKNWAVAAAGDGRVGNAVHATIEIGGAAFVMLLGLMLLMASLNA